MRYLLVNHIAAMPGRDAAHVSLPADWARELAAAGRAARGAGVQLIVATPIEPKPRSAGRRVDLVPDVAGFEHLPIPGYRSARTFLRVRTELRAALARAADVADIVQIDHGGWPVPLGTIAAREAFAARRRTVWTLGGDALPASRLGATARTGPRRLVGRRLDPRVGSDLFDAIRAATYVVVSREAIAERLRIDHGIASTWVDTLDLIDEDLAGARAVSTRHARVLDGRRPLRLLAVGPHTVGRRTSSIVRALHHAWRLRVPAELTILGDGSEIESLRALVAGLGLRDVVRFEADVDRAMADADVLVDADEPSAARAMARGVVPIVNATTRPDAPMRHVDAASGLAGAIVDAAVRRASLAASMLAGVEWCRSRTIESSYRRRFAIAATGTRRRPKHAA